MNRGELASMRAREKRQIFADTFYGWTDTEVTGLPELQFKTKAT